MGEEGRELGGGDLVDGLGEVVGGFVVAGADPVVESFLFGGVGGPAEFEGERGDALFDEVHLVGADEAIFVGLLVELGLDVVELADGAGVVAQGGFAEALDFKKAEGKEGEEHVHVEVGDDALLGNGGFGGEVLGAEFAEFFAGEGNEEDGAFEVLGAEECGGFDEGGDAAGVVHGAVVDGVAVEFAADAEVVKVGGDDDVLVFKLWVGAGEEADDVAAFDLCRAVHSDAGLEGAGDDKVRERLALVSDGLELGQGVACAGEELVHAGGGEGGGEAHALGGVEV